MNESLTSKEYEMLQLSARISEQQFPNLIGHTESASILLLAALNVIVGQKPITLEELESPALMESALRTLDTAHTVAISLYKKNLALHAKKFREDADIQVSVVTFNQEPPPAPTKKDLH